MLTVLSSSHRTHERALIRAMSISLPLFAYHLQKEKQFRSITNSFLSAFFITLISLAFLSSVFWCCPSMYIIYRLGANMARARSLILIEFSEFHCSKSGLDVENMREKNQRNVLFEPCICVKQYAAYLDSKPIKYCVYIDNCLSGCRALIPEKHWI